jgi:hypothetical protein
VGGAWGAWRGARRSAAAAARVSPFLAFLACIGSPWLKHCVHGASIGGGGGDGGGGAALLSQLHRWPRSEGVGARAPGCPPVLASFKQAGVAVPAAWDNCQARGRRGRHRLIQKFRNSPAYLHFLQVYRRFVADVIVPLVGDPHGVVFQCPPTYVRLLKIVIY